jgi:hypothetical protein
LKYGGTVAYEKFFPENRGFQNDPPQKQVFHEGYPLLFKNGFSKKFFPGNF